jgi:hypothetical protein
VSLLKRIEEIVRDAELRHRKPNPPAEPEAVPPADERPDDIPEPNQELRLELACA